MTQAQSFPSRLYCLQDFKEKANPRQTGSYMGRSLQNNQIDWQRTVYGLELVEDPKKVVSQVNQPFD